MMSGMSVFGRLAGRVRWVLGWRGRERARHARWDETLAQHSAELASVGSELERVVEGLGGRSFERLGSAEARLDEIARVQALAEDALAAARHAVARSDDALRVADNAADTAREALLPARIAALGAWLELHPPSESVPISIVLPSRDRPQQLPGALASVLRQRYRRWQLVVVDDGETDAVPAALSSIEDDRVVVVAGPRRGLGAARNAGLERADGEVICYLDDDNVMHPGWLQTVAHVFAAREDVDVAYGVTLAQHRLPDVLDPTGWWPSFWQLPFSREAVLEQNPADAGALAHRREIEGARFDEELSTGEDWDLLIRLTAERDALAVPALAHAYTLDAEDRMSRDRAHHAGLEAIRRRHAGG